MHRINMYGERGQPWRTPLCIEKKGDKNPFEQDTFILAKYWFNPGHPSLFNWKIVDGT